MGNNNFSRPDDCAPTGFKGYANSKLATLLAAQEWQRRFRSSESMRHDIAVAVHPGLVDTELARGWLTGADVTGRLYITQRGSIAHHVCALRHAHDCTARCPCEDMMNGAAVDMSK